MYDTTNIQIERKSEVAERLRISLNAVHLRIESGFLPSPINLGGRSVGFIKQEIDIIFGHMIQGKTADEIKTVTKELIKFRKTAANDLIAA
jgi:predicted DNA-binding transcriptional regulator AlpA